MNNGPAAGAGGEHRLLAGILILLVILLDFGFRGWGGVFQQPNERAARDLDDEILAGMAIHAFAQAAVAIGGDQARDVILLNQVVEVVIGLEDDAAAASAVAAAGTALGHKSFAMKGHTTAAAMAGVRVDFYFVNKHAVNL